MSIVSRLTAVSSQVLRSQSAQSGRRGRRTAPAGRRFGRPSRGSTPQQGAGGLVRSLLRRAR